MTNHFAAVQEALDARGVELTREDCEVAARAALTAEADWLDEAHRNSVDKGFANLYRDGFKSAAGWVRFHAARVL